MKPDQSVCSITPATAGPAIDANCEGTFERLATRERSCGATMPMTYDCRTGTVMLLMSTRTRKIAPANQTVGMNGSIASSAHDTTRNATTVRTAPPITSTARPTNEYEAIVQNPMTA